MPGTESKGNHDGIRGRMSRIGVCPFQESRGLSSDWANPAMGIFLNIAAFGWEVRDELMSWCEKSVEKGEKKKSLIT